MTTSFEPDGRGGWRRFAGLFDGDPSGPLFRKGRSRSNWDQATMGGADDINILPPDTGPGTPHCAADMNADGVLDFFDFLAFQDAFAAGCWREPRTQGAPTSRARVTQPLLIVRVCCDNLFS